jgi:hypothetical protein
LFQTTKKIKKKQSRLILELEDNLEPSEASKPVI